MSGQPMNLQPYGSAGIGASNVAEGSMEQQALQRAMIKLQHMRSGQSGDRKAGIDKRRFTIACVLAVVVGLPFGALTFVVIGNSGTVFEGAIPLVLSLLVFSIPVIYFVTSRPDSPKRLLTQYYRMLGWGRYGRAKQLVVNPDFDGFPRLQPFVKDLGDPTGAPYAFAHDGAFDNYWGSLVRSNSSPYCHTRVRNIHETQVATDVVIVDFELKLTMNTSLWFLLFFVIGIFAVVVDLLTRKVVTVQMRKVLVRVGDEWKMLSGEWQGYAEYDTSWLS